METHPEPFFDLAVENTLKGLYNLAQAVRPFLSVGGSFITVSASEQVLQAGNPAYAAVKSGVIGLSRRLAKEFYPDGVRVNSIGSGLSSRPTEAGAGRSSRKPVPAGPSGGYCLRRVVPGERRIKLGDRSGVGGRWRGGRWGSIALGAREMTIWIRPAEPRDAVGIAKVHVESWRSTYRGIVPDNVLENLSESRREKYWREDAIPDTAQVIYIASRPGGEIVGFVSGGPEREEVDGYDGELFAIYMNLKWSRHGIGTQLFRVYTRTMVQLGYRSILVWVLADNPMGRGFYEKMGGIRVAKKSIQIGGDDLEEIAYGWENLRDLDRLEDHD